MNRAAKAYRECALVAVTWMGPLCPAGSMETPIYVATALEKDATCNYAPKWDTSRQPHTAELAVSTLNTPISWTGFNSQRDVFGYRPGFPPGPVSLAYNGRPIIRDRQLRLHVLRDDGTWQVISLESVATESLARQGYTWTTSADWGTPKFSSAREAEASVVFDRYCHAYTVVDAFRSSLGFAFLLHSPDGGHTWGAYPLDGGAELTPTGSRPDHEVRMELPTRAGQLLDEPPVLILHRHAGTGDHVAYPDTAALLFPEKTVDGRLTLQTPALQPARIHVPNTICCGAHSGATTHVVSDGDLVHFVFPGNEAEPVANGVGTRSGTPQFAITYERSTLMPIGGPTKIGWGFDSHPGFDTCTCWGPQCPTQTRCLANPHDQPALAVDTAGYLHAVIPGHGAEVVYRRSTEPHSTAAWSAPDDFSDTSNHYGYSYPALFMDSQDQPHVISRWQDPQYRFLLVHRHRNAATGGWASQRTLLNPGRRYYGAWYHKVTADAWGRIFVSYSYNANNLFSDELTALEAYLGFQLTKGDAECEPSTLQQETKYCDYFGYDDINPGILLSRDDGSNFSLVTTDSFFEGMPATAPPEEDGLFYVRHLLIN
jgi:hypothetical protein